MAKMTKKHEEEYAFFIKSGMQRRRMCYFEKCKHCKNDCKQSFRIKELQCPDYISKK